MVRCTVTLALLFLTCVYAAPAPYNSKVILLRDSTLGYNLKNGNDKKSGKLDGTRTIDFDLPPEAAKKAPEIILLENVNSGAGIAFGGHIDFQGIKNKLLAGKNPFWRRK